MSFQFFLLANTTLIVMVSMIPDLVPSMPPYNFRGLLSFTIVFSASYCNVLAAYFSCSVFPPLCSLDLIICRPLPFPNFSCFPLEAATAIALNWFPVSSPGVLSLLSFFVVQLGSTLAELRFELLFFSCPPLYRPSTASRFAHFVRIFAFDPDSFVFLKRCYGRPCILIAALTKLKILILRILILTVYANRA